MIILLFHLVLLFLRKKEILEKSLCGQKINQVIRKTKFCRSIGKC